MLQTTHIEIQVMKNVLKDPNRNSIVGAFKVFLDNGFEIKVISSDRVREHRFKVYKEMDSWIRQDCPESYLHEPQPLEL